MQSPRMVNPGGGRARQKVTFCSLELAAILNQYVQKTAFKSLHLIALLESNLPLFTYILQSRFCQTRNIE